ncbi:uncharacterized protein ACRADG_010116 [Cochliomyia hominivorax]
MAFESNAFVQNRIADNSLVKIILKSNTLIQDNPQRSMECFASYLPKINEITLKYEAEYETCLNRSADARSKIDAEVQSDRKDLELSALDFCNAYEKCSNYHAAYDAYECYNNVSSNASKATYNIQNASKDKMEYIRMKFETIEYEQNRCTEDCSRTYKEASTKAYAELDKCLAGIPVEESSEQITK